jgi:putative colanic acid biosynthesis UDP-glucose lipid carrier transferase
MGWGMLHSHGTTVDQKAVSSAMHDEVAGWCWPISYASIGIAVCALDVLLILATGLVTGAVYSRLLHDSNVDLVQHASTALIVSAVFIPIFRNRGLYDPSLLVNGRLQVRSILVLWTLTFLVFAGAVFALKIGRDFSRGAVLSFSLVGLGALVVHHSLWQVLIETGLKKGRLRGRKSILLCMHDFPEGAQIARNHSRHLEHHGYRIDHVFQLGPGTCPRELIEVAVTFARGSEIEEIFVAADLQRWPKIRDLIQKLCDLPLPLTLLPDEKFATLFERTPHRFGPSIGIEFQRAPLTNTERFFKRSLDLVISIGGILVLMPMLLIVALAIKVDSPGPTLFVQTRHGFNSKRFKIFKFRTMTVLEDGETIKQAVQGDERVTRVGAWLRRTSIDELPQLFNVLIGDMSIVGPRPHAAAHDSYYAKFISHYAFRHHMKPGITGWAQIHGLRGITPTLQSMKDRIDLDIWYVDNWSLWLDIKIIFRTAIELIRQRNAY